MSTAPEFKSVTQKIWGSTFFANGRGCSIHSYGSYTSSLMRIQSRHRGITQGAGKEDLSTKQTFGPSHMKRKAILEEQPL